MGVDAAGIERSRPLYEVTKNDKKRVAYFYDSDIGNYAYVTGHPMKPHRIRLAHSLVMNYGVYKFLEVYRAKPAVFMEMTQFHTDEYIDFLQKVTPDNMDSYMREQGKYNVGDDCPVFDGLFEFCGISAGGSMEGAARLNRNKCDIAINWAGGLHHAKKSEASGFCYVNDIVLAIIELLRFNKRVLYIDIDVHHGDGVEEAFYTTDRVMTASFHKYGEYFPGTGELRDTGIGPGKNYAVNFPLRDGIDDDTYKTIFQPVITSIMQYFQPDAVVLQCGGDSLSGDRLGCFNLSMRGHANCVSFVRGFNLPTLVVGGGGYTMRNVARTWAFETGRLVGVEMDSVLPYNEYYEYYGPDYELDVRSSNMENANSPEYLEKIKIAVIENLKKTAPVPSVQMQDIPRQSLGMTDEEEAELDDLDEDENKDVRMTQRQWEKTRARDDEFEESDDEEMAQANGVNYDGPPRRSIMDYKNPNADYEFDSGAATPKPRESETPAEKEKSAAPAAAATETPAETTETKDVEMEDVADETATPAEEEKKEDKKEKETKEESTAAPSTDAPAAEAAAAEEEKTESAAAPEAEKKTEEAKPANDDGDVEMTDVVDEEPAAAAPAAEEKKESTEAEKPTETTEEKKASEETATTETADKPKEADVEEKEKDKEPAKEEPDATAATEATDGPAATETAAAAETAPKEDAPAEASSEKKEEEVKEESAKPAAAAEAASATEEADKKKTGETSASAAAETKEDAPKDGSAAAATDEKEKPAAAAATAEEDSAKKEDSKDDAADKTGTEKKEDEKKEDEKKEEKKPEGGEAETKEVKKEDA